jgi:general secretion pathway protein B
MSFILDAIAKSEQERRQLDVPDAASLSIPQQERSSRRRWLPLLLLAALLINVAVMIIWFQSDQSAEGDNIAAIEPVSQVMQGIEQISDSEKVVEDRVISKPKMLSTPAPKASADEPAEVLNQAIDLSTAQAGLVEKDETEGWVRVQPDTLSNATRDSVSSSNPEVPGSDEIIVTRLYELPDSVRKDLPTVKFSGHLYSSNPASSVVFLDNQRPVMQGQRIVDEVFLHEITTDGVVVRFRGYLISVGVLQNWTLN